MRTPRVAELRAAGRECPQELVVELREGERKMDREREREREKIGGNAKEEHS